MTKKNKNYGIKELWLQELFGVFEQIDTLDQVILYGSRARGDYKPRSDIDIAYTLEDNKEEIKLQNLIYDSSIFLNVDYTNLKHKYDQKFMDNLKKDGIVLWERSK